MKVNLKKIGAIVAGATILASSVSFAGLMFGSTQLVDNNGAPVAKVVVGDKAAASDGVAAALIASKLVSEAYKSSNVTAKVSGTATCTASGAAGGNCTVSGETVTLEVTVPGAVVAGTHTVNNLIGDYLNRDLLDRDEGQTNYSMTGSDTVEPANPFKCGGTLGACLGPSEIEMYRVSGTMFTPLATTTLTDDSAARNYQETQDIWMRGQNKYSDSNDDVIGRLNFVSYTLKFKGSGDDLGIPVCTTPSNSTLYSYNCGDYATASHKLQVKFLGEDWIVSEMSAPSTTLNNENNLVGGTSYVKLAKESVSGILNQGESLTVDSLKFQLDDLEAHGDVTSAIISVLDANGNVLKKDKVFPGTTKEFNIQSTSYRFHVYKVAPGYTFGAKWADVAVFSKELKLAHGQKLDPDYDDNKYWYVYLGWKNKGGSTSDTQPDHLRTIILHADDMSSLSTGGDSDMEVGDSIPIVMDPVRWKLSYNGLDLDGDDYDFLNFDLDTSPATVSAINGPLDPTNSSIRNSCNITAPYVKVRSGKSGSTFQYGSTASDDEFWVLIGGANCTGGTGNLNPGSLFMKESASSDYWTATPYSGEMKMQFAEIGDGTTNWEDGGVIAWVQSNETSGDIYSDLGALNGSAAVTDWMFGISENAGTGVSLGREDKMYFGLDTSTGPSSADFNIDDGTFLKKDYVKYNYTGPVDTGLTFAEEGFITERGSVFKDISKTSVRFSMANDLAHAQWYLASVSANVTPGTTQVTLKEGETKTVSSVTIKAKSIDQTAVCAGGAGGTPVCTANMTPVSAMLMKDGTAVTGSAMTAATPYDFTKYSPLVMLDKDAAGVSTVISVGGDAVNTVTKSILSGTTVDWTTNPVMVKEVVKGSKIVVAGKTAADTTTAASNFLKNLTTK